MTNQSVDGYIIKCEQEILTNIFSDPIAIEECCASLDASDFIDEKNAKIFGAISEIHMQHQKQINKNIAIDYISKNTNWQFDNWQSYLEEIANGFAYGEDFKANIELVKNASIKRQLDAFAHEIIGTKLDYAKYDDQIYQIEKRFLDITQSKHTSRLSTMNEIGNQFFETLNKIRTRKQEITGTPVGFPELDKTTNGFQPGDLIILAARPGVGKTAISMNFINNAAKKIKNSPNSSKDRIVVFSLEMGAEQLCQRLVSMNAPIDASALRSGKMSDLEWTNVQNAIEEIKTLPILIDDKAVSVVDIQSKLKQLKTEYNIKLVIVDYIQLMKGPAIKNSQANRQQEVSVISRMMKLLARRIEAPIIALAQLSRRVEQNGGEPKLSDLRESGSLEQDADIVCFLNLHEQPTENDEGAIKAVGPKTIVEQPFIDFIIAKHRNGSLKTIPMVTNRRTGMFYERIDNNGR